MAAKSSKGIKVCMTSAAPAVATPLVPTAITAIAATGTNQAGAEITVANTVAVGEVVSFEDTGFQALDGKSFVVVEASATEFKVRGLTLDAGVLGASPKVTHYVEATDFTCLCLSSLSIASDTPGTISTATYCDPTASIPSSVSNAGTLSFAGFVDTTAKDYPALLQAVEDGKQRVIRIALPGNGYISAPLTFSSITWDLPLDGAIGFSGTATLGSKPDHQW